MWRVAGVCAIADTIGINQDLGLISLDLGARRSNINRLIRTGLKILPMVDAVAAELGLLAALFWSMLVVYSNARYLRLTVADLAPARRAYHLTGGALEWVAIASVLESSDLDLALLERVAGIDIGSSASQSQKARRGEEEGFEAHAVLSRAEWRGGSR